MQPEILKRIADLKSQGLTIKQITEKLREEFGVTYSPNYIKKTYYQRAKALDSTRVEGISYFRYSINQDFFSIILVADLHLRDEKQAEQAVERIKSHMNKNTYLIFLGDIIQLDISPPANIFNSNPLDNVKALSVIFDAFKDRTICAVSGNHEDRLIKKVGIDINKFLCGIFSIPYSDSAAFIDLCYSGIRKSIYCLHGTSAAARIGGKLNRLEDLERVVDADIYVQAHTHVPAVFYRDRFYSDGYSLKRKSLIFINLGASQGYEPYAVKRGYAPATQLLTRLDFSLKNVTVHNL
jgi:predicted phosphodiesterase